MKLTKGLFRSPARVFFHQVHQVNCRLPLQTKRHTTKISFFVEIKHKVTSNKKINRRGRTMPLQTNWQSPCHRESHSKMCPEGLLERERFDKRPVEAGDHCCPKVRSKSGTSFLLSPKGLLYTVAS